MQSVRDTAQNQRLINHLFEEARGEDYNAEQSGGQGAYENIDSDESIRRSGQNDNNGASNGESNGRSRELHKKKSERNGNGNYQKSARNNQVKHFLKTQIQPIFGLKVKEKRR